MPKKSATAETVRRTAEDIPPATASHLAHLLGAMEGPVDTSEIPETKGRIRRVKRDAAGRLPKPREGSIRSAILAELERRGMTRYQLWQSARGRCTTLPAAAVYEYLRGQRDIGVPYVEALMASVGLVVVPSKGIGEVTIRTLKSKRRRAKASA